MSETTKQIDTGGQAFPSAYEHEDEYHDAVMTVHRGMTKREYVAAMVLQAVIWPWYEGGRPSDVPLNYCDAVRHAYKVADAFIAAGKDNPQ